MYKSVLLYLLVLSTFISFADPDEGMWLPMHVKRFANQDLQKQGLHLTADEIYNINNSSLKDALVMLGGGFCTAEIVSSKGLLFTNHHCGYHVIQSHSTLENNYLRDGFWAKSKKEELKNEGLTASILVRMKDLTATLLEAGDKKAELIDSLKTVTEEDGKYEVQIKPFFEGNEYYMFVYKTFKDVRLVGTPPSSVGKFGGDTDNWMWTRHTGDFSIFRIYTGKEGEPKEYAEDNVPYTPAHHLPISLKGYQENDFAMVMGFPGSTDRYLPSAGVKSTIEVSNPSRVKARRKKLDIIESYMNQSDAIRIKYASKHARISNYWKYFIGQTKGLKALKVYEQKVAEETAFQTWVDADTSRNKYKEAVTLMNQGYEELAKTQLARNYLIESIYGIELFNFAFKFSQFQTALKQDNQELVKELSESLKEVVEEHFKDYEIDVDKTLAKAMLKMYCEQIPFEQLPTPAMEIIHKHKKDYHKYVESLYSKSILSNKEKTLGYLNNPQLKTLLKDPGFQTAQTILAEYKERTSPGRIAQLGTIKKGKKLYIQGIREMNTNKAYYPDANSTPRFNPGKVLSYVPRDAVNYNYFTTAQGILEKEDPNNPEFIVPAKLKTLIENKDYGQYGQNDTLMVNFITNNDITGGNSGSPVVNGDGQLIGIAFDGNWEAMSGDIAFEHTYQRCIAVDIRYVLFIMDKYAGATNLIEELSLVK